MLGALLLAAPLGCRDRGRASTEPDDDRPIVVTNASELAATCRVDGASTFFPSDSASIDAPTAAALRAVAQCVRDGRLADKKLVLIGHTDPRGDYQHNDDLAISRAEAVAAFLRGEGVEPTRIEINSVGEGAASQDVDEWPLDRRVEIRVEPMLAAAR